MDFYIKDFLHLSEDNDSTLAFIEAVHALKSNPGSTLHLSGGTYHFYQKHAFEKEYYISNNDYSRKSIIFPLLNCENVTIDGEGAELLFHGEILPFVLDNSKNVCLKNFVIDYPEPYFYQATITESGKNFFVVKADPIGCKMRVEDYGITFYNSSICWESYTTRALTTEFDASTTAPSAYIPPYFLNFEGKSDGSFLEGMYRYVTAKQIDEDTVYIEGNLRHTHNVGNKLICTCGPGRRCPGILINKSDTVYIDSVTLHSTASMGIVGQLSKDVTMTNVKTVPRENSGRFLSVNADSTHFINCEGAIKYENCVFTNMLDDAVNVHGNYLKIVKQINAHTLLLTFGHFQQEGINIFDEGDKIRFVDNEAMTEIGLATVKSAELISSKYVRLEVCEELPELKEGNTVENFTKMPELYINNCVSGHNRPRGFLPSTWRKTVITNNIFFNMSCGLHFTGDSNDWFEAGHVEDVLIKGNKFRNSAYTGGAAIVIDPHVLKGDKQYHRNIIIEDNEFEQHEERFLIARYTDGLVFKNNRFIKNESFPAHQKIGEKGVMIADSCKNVEIDI